VKKLPYARPEIAARTEFEVNAMSCHKLATAAGCTKPCGYTCLGKSGTHHHGCYMNPQTRCS
jgi:hypothetical protein